MKSLDWYKIFLPGKPQEMHMEIKKKYTANYLIYDSKLHIMHNFLTFFFVKKHFVDFILVAVC